MRLGHLLAQQPVGSDQRLAGAVDDDEMIADGIERIAVHPRRGRHGVGPGRSLLVEHLVAQALRSGDLFAADRMPDHEIARCDIHRRLSLHSWLRQQPTADCYCLLPAAGWLKPPSGPA
jgi:hypothetical protein